MNSEQPLLADLQVMPTASDACLVCTNVRYLDGKKPSFIDKTDSWFLVPLGIVRFVEVPKTSIDQVEGIIPLHAGMMRQEPPEPQPEFDSDLLKRLLEA